VDVHIYFLLFFFVFIKCDVVLELSFENIYIYIKSIIMMN
jgi:hypothetical protein